MKDKRRRKEWEQLDIEVAKLMLDDLRQRKAMHEEAVRLSKKRRVEYVS